VARRLASLPTVVLAHGVNPRVTTVHQVKGDEAAAVLICTQTRRVDKSSDAIEHWLSNTGSTSEALRVLYVAATRARRLLALALPTQLLSRATTHLEDRGIEVLVR
jgi:superfamily I DNA/RNA helicase